MGWTELDRSQIAPGTLGNTSAWTVLADNHDQLYRIDGPPVLAQSVSWTETQTSATDHVVARVRGNDDQNTWLCRVEASASSGDAGDVRFTVGAVAGSVSVDTTVWRWYWIAVTPGTTGWIEAKIQTQVDSATDELYVRRVEVYLGHPLPTAGTESSGFVRLGSWWGDSNDPIPSEVVERQLNGPVQIGVDRPRCVFAHTADVQGSISAKDTGQWGGQDLTVPTLVGRGLWIPPYPTARQYTIDMYSTQTGSGIDGAIYIGTAEIPIPGAGWQNATNVILPADPAEIRVELETGSSNTAALRTLQIWRT